MTRGNPQYFFDLMSRGDHSSSVVSEKVGSYGIWGASAGYKFDSGISIRAGISNILDKKLYRNGGAQTYNEMGRAYYTTLKYSF